QIVVPALYTFGAFVAKSLVRHSGKRFAMLETIREYAAERFKDPEIRRRHAEYFLALAEDAAPHLLRGDPKLWLDRLGSDHDNLRAALDHLSDVGAGGLEQRRGGGRWGVWA